MCKRFKYSLDELQSSRFFVLKKIMILLWLFIVLEFSCRNSFKVQNASLEMHHELVAAAIGTHKIDSGCIHYETCSSFYCSCCCYVCRKTWTSSVVML